MNYVASAIEHIGLTNLANRFGFYASAVQKWRDKGALPMTELSSLTNYAEIIEEMTGGTYKAKKLIDETRRFWIANPPRGRKRAELKAVG